VSLLPLFPLPNVVLFPGVLLPLHVFEPRYRALVTDTLEADRLIGMALLRPGWETDYEGRPPIFATVCRGVITHDVRLDDGRYHIVVRGVERVRVVEEDHARPYRRARVELLPDSSALLEDATALSGMRRTLETALGIGAAVHAEDGDAAAALATMPDEDFVHTLAQYLDLDPLEKQALLEIAAVHERAQALIDLLEMKRLLDRLPDRPTRPH
jgi:Lon protease-like protein